MTGIPITGSAGEIHSLEAGLQPNAFGVRFSEELMVKKYIELDPRTRRFPIAGDLLKKATDGQYI